VANQPKILARRGHSIQGDRSGTFESAQCVDPWRSFELSSAKIQASDRQNIFVSDDSCRGMDKVEIIILENIWLFFQFIIFEDFQKDKVLLHSLFS
jgi:hypothetical protein